MNNRLFELKSPNGHAPMLINPKSLSPYRVMEHSVLGWLPSGELYGSAIPITLFQRDPGVSLKELDEFLWQNKNYFMIYTAKEDSIGAVVLTAPFPKNYQPQPIIIRPKLVTVNTSEII